MRNPVQKNKCCLKRKSASDGIPDACSLREFYFQIVNQARRP
ncbi:hypothetical protein F528_1058 [Neisseria meningitidis 992008]|nr:hypothetical protein F528_1058 [Neisseria meningitidis 992008]